MTVETTDGSGNPIVKSGPYNGNGVTADFDYDFQIQDEAELRVTRQNVDLSEDVLEITTHYTVAGVGADAGGTITLVDPATDLTTGEKLVIQYDGSFTQSTDYSNQGSVKLELLESALDKLTMHLRALKDLVDRAVKVDAFDTVDLDTLTANIAVAAGLETEIATIAGLSTEIAAVYADIADINTLAAISGDVTTAAGIAADISTVAADGTDIGVVAGLTTEINAIYTNLAGLLATEALTNLVADTTPQLGGDLDANGFSIDDLKPVITLLNTAGSGTHNLNARTKRLRIKQRGGGGQGGGANSAGSDHGVGGGGGAGGLLEFEVDVAALGITSFNYTIGAGGTGGGNGGNGGAGGSTTYSDGTNTMIAGGGAGGTAQTNITSMTPADGGDGGVNNVTGLVSGITVIQNRAGAPGENGIGYMGAGAKGGNGGASEGGNGKGARRGSTGGTRGDDATGTGCGGGGCATLNSTSAVAGGLGKNGGMIAEELFY